MPVSTTAPLSEVAIANMAIDVLDDDPITDLSDDTVVGRFMARNFGRVRDQVLTAFPWNVVRTRAALPADGSDPAFGWANQYTVPEDCLRLLPLRECGLLNGRQIPYEYEDRKVLTNAKAPLLVRYIRRETNVALFSPLLAAVIAYRLALLAAMNITGKSTYVDKAKSLLSEAWEEAKLVETLESGTPEEQDGFDILDIRGIGL